MRERLDRAGPAPAQGPDVARRKAELLETLREEPGARGFAVGAGDADHAQPRRRLLEEAIGHAAHEPGQPLDGRDQYGRGRRGRRRQRRRRPGRPRVARRPRAAHPRNRTRARARARPGARARRVKKNRARPGARCGRCMLEAVRATPRQRKEQIARLNRAAVEREAAHLHLSAPGRHGRDAFEQFVKRNHGWPPASTSRAAGTLLRSSGGTSMSRSAPDITLANTGAATLPPWCSPLGSSMTTTVAIFGCEAGTSPAKTAMKRSVE